MPGTFSKTNRPRRPGAYINWEAVAPVQVAPAIGGIVAIPLTHDWGPLEVPTLVNSLAEWRSVFGPTETTPGYLAVAQAFRGEGVPDSGGAGAVLVYRAGSDAAAKSTITLKNTTPVDALVLDAIYEGTRGDNLNVTVQDNAGDATKSDLILYENTVELERWTYLDADIGDLVDQINGAGDYALDPRRSDWITATLTIDAVALGTVTNSAFAGGDDGETLVADDWTDALDALAPERFSVMAPYDLTDDTILASILDWSQTQNAAGKRFMTVFGGEAAEDAATAIGATSGAGLMNDPNFIRVGMGTMLDYNMLDAVGDPTSLSSSQLAPRVAGILAQFGEVRGLTYARLQGLKLLNGATDAEMVDLIEGGVVALSLGSDPTAPVRIEKGVTTYTTITDLARPYLIYRNPKFVRTMHAVELEIQEWADINVVGKLPVNDKTRDYVVGEVSARLAARENLAIIQSGWTVGIDTDPPPSDDDEFIALVVGLRFGRSAEQAFFTFRVG